MSGGVCGGYTWTDPLLAMHSRSEAASADENAQQQPQLLWSRMSPIIFPHCGQLAAESKETWGLAW